MFFSKLLISVEKNYWSIELKMTALIWIIKKVKHLIEFSKFSVIIQIDHSTTIDIYKQKLITNTNFFIRSNIRLIRVSQYLSQFSLDVKHKLDKNNVVSNALFKLINIETISFEQKDYSEFDALYIYNTTLIEIDKNFKKKLFKITQAILNETNTRYYWIKTIIWTKTSR